MSKLKQEVDKLQTELNETHRKLVFKTIANNIVEQIDEMIKIQRGGVISPDSAALVSSCTQLRALLLAEEVGKPKIERHDDDE